MPQVYRPIPRRAFEITPASTDTSTPPSPATEAVNTELLAGQRADSTPSRTRSILNLTSSTLLGIYSSIGTDGSREELSTPWGTGAQTPSKRRSIDDYTPQQSPLSWDQGGTKPLPKLKRKGFRGYVVPLFLQTVLLFGFGLGYGSIITHLHKTQRITPMPVPVPDIERNSLYYQLSWGIFGILLGNALPLVDSLWEKSISPAIYGDQATLSPRSGATKTTEANGATASPGSNSGLGPMWYSAVRSIGIFVGIAFAVVRCCLSSLLGLADVFS